MPLQYEGILAEYQNTRQKVSIFDISHMGEFIISGAAFESGLDRIVTQSLSDLPVKSSRYGMILNENGGVIDDLIVFRLEEEKWMVVVNAATMEKDAAHMLKHLAGADRFQNISAQTGKIDVQGPLSRDIMATFVKGLDRLEYFKFDTFDVLGEEVIVSRTGYTGELGYEIFYPWDKMQVLWQFLLDKGARPAGLGVRDVLRLEMGYSLYGHELSEEISPLEAGLERFVSWDKDFIGSAALKTHKASGVKRQNVGLVARSRRSPRANHNIYSQDGQVIGKVTSGSFSPALNCGIGLGLIERSLYQKGMIVSFGEEGNSFPADVARPPFYKQGSLKK